MVVYNLLEYNDNYCMTSGSLRSYYRDEVNNDANENNEAGNYRINNYKTTTSRSFQYKTKIIGSATADNNMLDTKVAVALKYLSNFWRSLDLTSIIREIELDLPWSKNFIITEISRTAAVATDPDMNPPVQARAARQITGAIFQTTSCKLYAPVVTLSIKQGFKRTISWNKYRSEITTQPKDNNLDYLTDPTFRNIHRLFFLSYKNGDNDPKRLYFDNYYILLVEIKDFNALIGIKPFFDQPIKNKQEAYEKLVEMSK